MPAGSYRVDTSFLFYYYNLCSLILKIKPVLTFNIYFYNFRFLTFPCGFTTMESFKKTFHRPIGHGNVKK